MTTEEYARVLCREKAAEFGALYDQTQEPIHLKSSALYDYLGACVEYHAQEGSSIEGRMSGLEDDIKKLRQLFSGLQRTFRDWRFDK